ncbi:MAG: alkaline phosphatase family protein [Nitrospirae bacterium]|nr:alkaline phosphatase family protein [Nitrospirota bacterium]
MKDWNEYVQNCSVSRRRFMQWTAAVLASLTGHGKTASAEIPVSKENKGEESKAGTKMKKFIYLGMDGLDPALLTLYMDKGHLPNFKLLAHTGSFAPLVTTNPPQSPVAWTTMATGKNPGKHGIFDFIHRDAKNYGLNLSLNKEKSSLLSGTSYERPFSEPTFWEITSKNAIPTTVIRWPLTFPAEATGDYELLAGLGVPDINGLLGKYTYYYTGKLEAQGDKSGRIVKLDRKQHIDTTLQAAKGAMGDPLSIPLSIEVASDDAALNITLQNNQWNGRQGQWSPWLPVKFRGGFIKTISAICQLYIVSAAPELGIYVTSVQFDPKEPLFPISTPDVWSKEIADIVGSYFSTLGMPEDVKALMEHVLPPEAFLQQSYSTLAWQKKLLQAKLEHFESGLMAIVFDTTDRISHMFWKDTDGGKALDKKNPILDVYVYMDEILGHVMEKFKDDTTILVSSDHGFAAYRHDFNVNNFLVKKGYMTLKTTEPPPYGNVLFSTVDWSKTKAYALGFNSLYINMAGREKSGIVTKSQVDGLRKKIKEDLLKFYDETNKEHPVAKVYFKEDIYKGIHLPDAPDIVVGMKPGYRYSWQTALGGLAEKNILMPNDKLWSGDHCFDFNTVKGIVLSNKKIVKNNPGIQDIAPTIIGAFGFNREDMDGSPLFNG